jgi:hypothetical protein
MRSEGPIPNTAAATVTSDSVRNQQSASVFRGSDVVSRQAWSPPFRSRGLVAAEEFEVKGKQGAGQNNIEFLSGLGNRG